MTIRSILLILSAILGIFTIKAQTQADINISEGGYGMVKTNISVDYDHTWGSVSDGFATRVSYEFFKNKTFTLTANGRYSSTTVDFGNGELSKGYNPEEIGINKTHILGQMGLTASTRAKLFGKTLMAIAMINSDWGTGGFERVSGTVMGLIILRANRDTRFGIGPLVMINTTSKIPIFPIFIYSHRFSPKLNLNLYGAMFGLEYTPTSSDMFTFGGDVDVKAFYFRPHTEGLPKICRFNKTSFRPMVKYRHRLAPNLYFDAKAGVSIKMSSRVNGINGTKEYFNCHQKTAPFVQGSISYSM